MENEIIQFLNFGSVMRKSEFCWPTLSQTNAFTGNSSFIYHSIKKLERIK
jgi:hypothetical protein